MNSKPIIGRNNRLIMILTLATALVLLPLIAMQFSNEVNWSLSDFVIAAILLFGTGLLCELVLRRVTSPRHRIILCGIILVALVVVWAELAVGIFGTPWAGS